MRGGGFAVADSPESKVDFYSLAGAVTSWDLPEEEALQLKATDEFTVVGQPVARIDIPDKVTGQAVYGYDMRAPNMLYGAVARPPTLEAKLVGASAGEAAAMEGVEEVVIDVGKRLCRGGGELSQRGLVGCEGDGDGVG